MRRFFRRLIYGRRYSKPSDRLFQDHILEEQHYREWSENPPQGGSCLSVNCGVPPSIYKQPKRDAYGNVLDDEGYLKGSRAQLYLTFKDAKSKEEAQHKLESAHDLKLGGVWLPKGSAATYLQLKQDKDIIDKMVDPEDERNMSVAESMFGPVIIAGMVASGSLLLAAVFQWALTL